MSNSLVSVVIRTCQRPNIVRNALNCLVEQTFQDFEVIVVEDGGCDIKDILNKEYKNLKTKYHSFEKNVGRTMAGNQGLSMAEGTYINFLDDDDILYPNHIETLVKTLQRTNEKIAYSVSEESQIMYQSLEPLKIKEKRTFIRFNQKFSRGLLYNHNYLPIQSVMFERSLYQELGGFDTSLQYLEDWDLWIRYSTVTDFAYVNKVTSCYRVGFNRNNKEKRQKEIDHSLGDIYKKMETYKINIDVKSISEDMKYILTDYNEKKWERWSKIIIRKVLFGDR